MDLKSPSSGDCVSAADECRHKCVGADVATELAAPFYRITDPNRHGAKCSPESADGSRAHRR
jgi:hypothetical protein